MIDASNGARGVAEIIVTMKPGFIEAGLNEVFAADRYAKWVQALDRGVGIVRLNGDFTIFANALAKTRPIFVQHVFPVHMRVARTNERRDVNALADQITEQSDEWMARLDSSRSFSVQVRSIGGMEERSIADVLVKQLVSIGEKRGLAQDVADPEQVVSVMVTTDHVYIGISLARDNLSDWAGGRHRFAREAGQISRAEFKLLEAIDVFGVDLPKQGVALDLGAAPGGWSRVLLERGLQVIAVDPADLHPSLANHSLVTHVKETAQSYLRRSVTAKFDVIVNDMRMDALESAALMVALHSYLKAGGFAVMTAKLAERHAQRAVREVLDTLSRRYAVVGARQLFHNRSEVTIYLKKAQSE